MTRMTPSNKPKLKQKKIYEEYKIYFYNNKKVVQGDTRYLHEDFKYPQLLLIKLSPC